MKKVKVAILGFGQRGFVYANIIKNNPDLMELVSVCEINPYKKPVIMSTFNISEDNYFTDYKKMYEKGKLADVLIISTMDQDHYKQALEALEIGYDLLLEKPIAVEKEHIIDIMEKAKQLKRKVAVAHVLRYTPFYQKLKLLIDDDRIGKVQAISQTENIGYFHFAHSYVRGNWRKKEDSAPMILAKACHDLDIIKYLVNDKCVKLSSFGNLNYFKKENAPKGSATHCYKCEVECPFNAVTFYKENPMWAMIFSLNPNIEEVFMDENLSYAKCVYKLDNNVPDSQTVNLEFKNGVVANLMVTAFSKETHRQIKIHGSMGEIEADLEARKIVIKPYLGEDEIIDLSSDEVDFSFHQGGDNNLLVDFAKKIQANEDTGLLTTIEESLESHILAIDAEESRLNKGKVFTYE